MPIDAQQNEVKQYIHEDKKRINNPPIGLVRAETDDSSVKKTYQFDPYLDPQLQWAGKAEGLSFDVDTVSLHVHERIDPLTIIEGVRTWQYHVQKHLFHYFEEKENNPSYREALEFYKHSQGWSNRLIAGDSLLVMNSMLEKEGMAGKIQTIYIDPPYGIKYGSNFQPFVNKRNVVDRKDDDLTQEPEMIKAFRDTWELEVHSYLTYLRNNLKLARDLLTPSGSCFVQISDENVHHVREIMDEIFGKENFVSQIIFVRGVAGLGRNLSNVNDHILWFAKDKVQVKYRGLFVPRSEKTLASAYNYVEEKNGIIRRLSEEEITGMTPIVGKRFKSSALVARDSSPTGSFDFSFENTVFKLPPNTHWKTNRDGLTNLIKKNRLTAFGKTLVYKMYADDFPYVPLSNIWNDVFESTFAVQRIYVVQTAAKVIERCILMTSDPGNLIFDPTSGSGTTAFVAEKWGRRWITCDTSRVSITLAKQRLMTAVYDYYELANSKEGVSSGFNNEKVPHVTLQAIANNEVTGQETLFDKPRIDKTKKRVTGPFTVEAVPSPFVKPVDDTKTESEADQSVVRSGETLRQDEWQDELLKTGIRGSGGQQIEFSRVETLSGAKWLHADAETKEREPKRVVVSFGPDFAPLDPVQVELALEEASHLYPKPKIVVFAAFQFDPEAAKDIDVGEISGVNLIKVQMNSDLLTTDLKKKRSSNESFWLIGQPDVEIHRLDDQRIKVEVKGFDYYNVLNGQLDSGGAKRIAMWLLDTDYDYRSLYPRQVFFPLAGDDEGWTHLAKILKAEVDQELIEQYQGTISLPFKPGKSIAVKIIDDRGIESLKIIKL